MQRHRVASALAALVASIVLAACGGGSEGDVMVQAEPAAKGGGGSGGGGTKGATLVADAGVQSVTLAWNDTGAQQYNVYLSSSKGCDVKQYTLCPDGKMLANVTSPLKVGSLVNGRVYYAQVEAVSNRSTSLSNEAGARPTTLEFNEAVWSVATAADGTKYLGGDFTRVGLTSGQAVALDPVGGRPSIPGFPIIGDGGVTAAAPDGSGGWYIGGDFRRVGASSKPHLFRMRADGSVDPNWNPAPNSAVNTIAVMNGVVYIGGTFTAINGQQRLSLAALDAATGQLLPWNPVPNLGVWSIAAVNGTIYVGGNFTMIGGFYRNNAAAIDAFGNILPWDPNTNGTVATLVVANSTVYAGGFFSTVSGQARNKLAALDPVTGKPTAWNASLVCTACEVRALAVSGTTLYVGGRFPQIAGVARNALAAVDTRNAAVLPWNPNADAPVWSLGVTNDTRGTTVYAGGEFTAIGGQPRAYLAALDAQGAALATWAPAPTSKVEVVRIAGSHVLAGGRFTGLNAVVRNGLAAVDATGALKAWNPNANGGVRALAINGNAIYAGGTFSTVGGQAHGRIAKIDSSGTVDPWAPSFNWPVLALAVGSTGNLYVGGEFSTVNGTIRNRVAAFAANGQLLGWAPNPDHYVYALAVGPDLGAGETVYLGGQFGAVNGQVRRRIAQVDSGLGLPTAWNPWGYENVAQQDVVQALAYANGTVYAGGLFARLGANLSQISAAGVVTALGANGRVWALDVSGATLYLGGEFSQVYNGSGWVARSRVAALDTASRSVTGFAPNIGDREVYSIAVDGTGVHVGGSFTQVDGHVVSGFATVPK